MNSLGLLSSLRLPVDKCRFMGFQVKRVWYCCF